jgi:uncharacterized protein
VVRRASPVRTCVGCRSRAPAAQLLRVVAIDVEPPGQNNGMAVLRIVPDTTRRRPGRGAHIHPDPTCLELAVRRRAFGRALRLTGVVDAGLLAEHIGRLGKPVGGNPTPDQQGRTTDMSTR